MQSPGEREMLGCIHHVSPAPVLSSPTTSPKGFQGPLPPLGTENCSGEGTRIPGQLCGGHLQATRDGGTLCAP